MDGSLVFWVLIAVCVLAAISYNRFITQRTLILDAWANIDAELRRRYDLIPNLVETVKAYAVHELAVLEKVTQARAAAIAAKGTPAEQSAAEAPLIVALRELLALVEHYPHLRASGNFLKLQSELAITEDRLQTARRLYNANVRDHNQRVRQVPSNIIARLFGFTEAQFFTIEGVLQADAPEADFRRP